MGRLLFWEDQGGPQGKGPAAGAKISKKADVKKMTKHGFLDMIKQKAVEEKTSNRGNGDCDEPQWKALQDDYMLNPKKNWDQESSDDEDADDGDRMPKKKRKTAAA